MNNDNGNVVTKNYNGMTKQQITDALREAIVPLCREQMLWAKARNPKFCTTNDMETRLMNAMVAGARVMFAHVYVNNIITDKGETQSNHALWSKQWN